MVPCYVSALVAAAQEWLPADLLNPKLTPTDTTCKGPLELVSSMCMFSIGMDPASPVRDVQ
jgi:hypothetical protein